MRTILEGKALIQAIGKCVKNMPPNPVLDKIKTLVYEFKDTIPVVVAMRNPALTQVHWSQIKDDVIGQDFDIYDDEFTLQSLIDLDVQQHQAKIQDISTQATQEAMLEKQFYEIETHWKQQQFVVEPYKADVLL